MGLRINRDALKTNSKKKLANLNQISTNRLYKKYTLPLASLPINRHQQTSKIPSGMKRMNIFSLH